MRPCVRSGPHAGGFRTARVDGDTRTVTWPGGADLAPDTLYERVRTAAWLAFATDSFRIGELVAGDGSAIVIHAGRDNLANVPTRYHAHVPDASSTTFGPDPDTLKTGDAGSRFACGAVRARGR